VHEANVLLRHAGRSHRAGFRGTEAEAAFAAPGLEDTQVAWSASFYLWGIREWREPSISCLPRRVNVRLLDDLLPSVPESCGVLKRTHTFMARWACCSGVQRS